MLSRDCAKHDAGYNDSRAKKPVACLTKLAEKSKRKKRPLGSYEGKATYWEDESFEFTPEMLFDNMNDLS